MTSSPTPPLQRRHRRRWPFALAAMLVLAGGVLALGWRYRAAVTEQAALLALDMLDIGDGIDFHVVAVGPDFLRLENLTFGQDGPTAAAAEIVFSPSEIMDGRIRSIRLFEPVAALVQSAAGDVSVSGLPMAGDGVPATTPAFPELPDIGRIEIVDGSIRLQTPSFDASGRIDASIARVEPGRFSATAAAALADTEGREAKIDIKDWDVLYRGDRIQASGAATVHIGEAGTNSRATLALWANGQASPDGALQADVIVMSGSGQRGDGFRVANVRGRIEGGRANDAEPSLKADLNLFGIDAPPASIEFATLDLGLNQGAITANAAAVGPSGAISVALDAPRGRAVVTTVSQGEIDASLIGALLPAARARGRVRFQSDATAPVAALLATFDYRQLTGAIDLVFETPALSFENLILDGSAMGRLNVALAKGAATVTSPGLVIGGVRLPAASLARLPPDVRRAFEDPAFLRLGGVGLAATSVTVFEREDGGFGGFGKLSLGLSNPNLAVFLDGDADISITADGKIAEFTSKGLAMRLVDARLGPALISGRIDLKGLSGAGDRFAADAALALSGSLNAGGFSLKAAEIDLSGPITVDADTVALVPNPNGRIGLRGYAGPMLSSRAPVRLTLGPGGQPRIVYDRRQDALAADLRFRGFKTRATLNPDAASGTDGGNVDLALGGLGVALSPAGSALTLSDVAATFLDRQIRISGGDGRIAFGAAREQSGRLTIKDIRHLGETPLMRPLSLRLDVMGKGDLLKFEGALIAAGDRARLKMTGSHHLKTGVGGARLQLGPVVFAPGVLQPQDFAPQLYRTLIEAVGAATAEAAIDWSPAGITREHARLDLSVDKLRTSEIAVEQLTTKFELDGLLPLKSAGPQRIYIGRLDLGVPMTRGVLDINLISPERIDVEIDRFELFGGVITSQRLTIDPTQQSFDAALEVRGIDLASILAFAEFGELTATGKFEGRLPISYRNGELRIHDGLIKTGAGGGRLKYRPREIDEALKKADRSSKLAIQALANFAYDEISIRINELEGEELRLDIFIAGKSLDVFDGLPVEFNIVIEGPLRQLISESMAPLELPEDVQRYIDRANAPPLLPAPPR